MLPMERRFFVPSIEDEKVGYRLKHTELHEPHPQADPNWESWRLIELTESAVSASKSYLAFDSKRFSEETLNHKDPNFADTLIKYYDEQQADPTMVIRHGSKSTIVLRRQKF